MDKKCEVPPAYRFTWPGKDEDYICAMHAFKMQRIVSSSGSCVPFILLTPDEVEENNCGQIVEED